MSRPHLTAKSAAAAKPEADRYELKSNAVTGFSLRVQPSGFKAWYLIKRIDGKPVQKQIGTFKDMSYETAYGLAEEMAGQAARVGKVEGAVFLPKRIIETVVPAAPVGAVQTLGDVWAFYLRDKLANKSSAKDVQSKVEGYATALLKQELITVDREDAHAMLKTIESDAVHRNVAQALRAACNHCIDNPKASGWPKGFANPFARVKMPKARQRVRALSTREFAAFGKAALADEDQDAATFLIAIAECASRVNELRTARVHEWDAKATKLRLSAKRMKADEPGVMTFGPVAGARITALCKGKDRSDPIWPGDDKGGFRDFRKPMARVLKSAGIDHKSYHDFRRTITSILADAPFAAPHIEQHINHTLPPLVKSYWGLLHDHETRDKMARAAEKALLGK